VHESAEDVAALQELLDRSYAGAGPHLLSIHTPQRRLTAARLSDLLTGMRLLTLATVTADGRPVVGPVDGIFYRGAFYFGSSRNSVRLRHIRLRPWVSAAHVPSEELAVTVHGRAVPIDLGAPEHDGFRQVLLDVYLPRYGAEWEQFLEGGPDQEPPAYARIDAERMFALFVEGGDGAQFAQPLREADVDPDPFRQFSLWFEQARASGVRMPEAAALATATPDGAPSARMVLVKETGPPGFVFYSNFESRKGEELAANPRAALLFYWDPLGRQVRIEGEVRRIGEQASARYVRTRPRGSQLSALASPQSRRISGREELEQRVAELARAYDGSELPLPPAWGGFRLTPASFEFWQHRLDRLHDRLLYTPEGGGGWRLQRLAP
jgi:pyridoxamine 5'-phosphate oxidase